MTDRRGYAEPSPPKPTRWPASWHWAFDGHRNLETPAEPDVVRLLTEALEHACLEGADGAP